MTQKLLEEMTADEFELILDRFITREPVEVSSSVFFEALAQIDREKQKAAPVIRLWTRVVDNHLVFAPPQPAGTIVVRDNEIILDDGRHILLELATDQAMSVSAPNK